MNELSLEVTYGTDCFDALHILDSLSAFAELTGGQHFNVAASAIPGWAPQTKGLLKRSEAVKTAREQSEDLLELEVLFRFLRTEEMVKALSAAYRISIEEALESFDGNDRLSLGYANAYLKGYILDIRPRTSRLARFVMESHLTRSQLTNFCRITAARGAHWENGSDPEFLLPIYSPE